MKGVSDVIAVLLMLIITIGLAGLAYSYITGLFTSRTAVVLSVDSQASTCSNGHATIYVRNDGTSNATNVKVYIAPDPGSAPSDTACYTIESIAPGSEESATCDVNGMGYHAIRVTTSGSSATGTIYCTS